MIIVSLLIAGGYGTALHAIAGELYDKGGWREVLKFQGEYLGMAIMAIGIALNIIWLWNLED